MTNDYNLIETTYSDYDNQIFQLEKENKALYKEKNALKEHIHMLRVALLFYATPDLAKDGGQWILTYPGGIAYSINGTKMIDKGDIAADALFCSLHEDFQPFVSSTYKLIEWFAMSLKSTGAEQVND